MNKTIPTDISNPISNFLYQHEAPPKRQRTRDEEAAEALLMLGDS